MPTINALSRSLQMLEAVLVDREGRSVAAIATSLGVPMESIADDKGYREHFLAQGVPCDCRKTKRWLMPTLSSGSAEACAACGTKYGTAPRRVAAKHGMLTILA